MKFFYLKSTEIMYKTKIRLNNYFNSTQCKIQHVNIGVGDMYRLNVQEVRIKKGLNINQLAKLCKLSKSAISDIEHENRNPTLDTINKLARVLGPNILVWVEDKQRG